MPQPSLDRSSSVQPAGSGVSLSKSVLGIDWHEHGPWNFDDIVAVPACFEEALPFIRAHYASIFQFDDRFLNEGLTESKKQFLGLSDVFLFLDGEDVVGISISGPSDWSSYYVRSAAVLPSHRRRGLVPRLYGALEAPLRAHGVGRIDVDTSPMNGPAIHALSLCGYVITGNLVTERWGVIVRWTKFLAPDASAIFSRQFSGMTVGQSAAGAK